MREVLIHIFRLSWGIGLGVGVFHLSADVTFLFRPRWRRPGARLRDRPQTWGKAQDTATREIDAAKSSLVDLGIAPPGDWNTDAVALWHLAQTSRNHISRLLAALMWTALISGLALISTAQDWFETFAQIAIFLYPLMFVGLLHLRLDTLAIRRACPEEYLLWTAVDAQIACGPVGPRHQTPMPADMGALIRKVEALGRALANYGQFAYPSRPHRQSLLVAEAATAADLIEDQMDAALGHRAGVRNLVSLVVQLQDALPRREPLGLAPTGTVPNVRRRETERRFPWRHVIFYFLAALAVCGALIALRKLGIGAEYSEILIVLLAPGLGYATALAERGRNSPPPPAP